MFKQLVTKVFLIVILMTIANVNSMKFRIEIKEQYSDFMGDHYTRVVRLYKNPGSGEIEMDSAYIKISFKESVGTLTMAVQGPGFSDGVVKNVSNNLCAAYDRVLKETLHFEIDDQNLMDVRPNENLVKGFKTMDCNTNEEEQTVNIEFESESEFSIHCKKDDIKGYFIKISNQGYRLLI